MFHQQGWECPKCGTVYAPFMPSCVCSKEKNITSYLPSTNMNDKAHCKCMLMDGKYCEQCKRIK